MAHAMRNGHAKAGEDVVHAYKVELDPQQHKHDALKTALAQVRDRQLAVLIVIAVQLAVENHPEEVKAALGKVFDLGCVEDTTRRVMATANGAMDDAYAASCRARELGREVEGLRGEIDGLRAQVEELTRGTACADR